jgi:hypothetical protein
LNEIQVDASDSKKNGLYADRTENTYDRYKKSEYFDELRTRYNNLLDRLKDLKTKKADSTGFFRRKTSMTQDQINAEKEKLIKILDNFHTYLEFRRINHNIVNNDGTITQHIYGGKIRKTRKHGKSNNKRYTRRYYR